MSLSHFSIFKNAEFSILGFSKADKSDMQPSWSHFISMNPIWKRNLNVYTDPYLMHFKSLHLLANTDL